jgi:catechol 2,3-dioxygenase-like lactoylglutathione lyase family enzyme
VTSPLFTGANHVCVVTRDLDRAVAIWVGRFGVGPWHLWTKDDSNMSAVVDGRPESFAFRVGLCTLASGFRLELIQPLDDRGPYAASLDRHDGRDHVHHLRLDVGDYDDARERLVGLGLGVPLDASFDGAPHVESTVSATYFDTTDELGFTLEIGSVPPGFAMPEPELVASVPATRQEAR